MKNEGGFLKMITNLNKEYHICPECGHPYFKAETQYLFPNDVTFKNGISIPYKESITRIYCARCGAPVTSKHLLNVDLIKK